jgi:hypothetical protein
VNTTRGHERNHESEQIRGDRALLVADREGTVAELVDEHRVMQSGQVAVAPEGGCRVKVRHRNLVVIRYQIPTGDVRARADLWR